ncbi:DUF6571 family protein [Actinomyces sp. oral taxon 897]|uniref:DUF6571 family protein n=1 Tax=Actinomyces sp. oral taxon 897 TaxID=2081702 RepID=UPI000D03C50E|nr:DUF6571 family protein [Actinomyces sp. oral taxon 897]AVM60934.1 hypothetical protein C3V41_01285 [Actinomyces sp. oral taxon 897]
MIPADRPGRWVLVRRGTALAGCLVLSACLVLPTCRVSPRAAAAPLQDAPTTQVISGTAPAPTTGTGTTSPDTVRNPGTTSPGAATSATAAGTDPAGADAALGDAVVLAEALDEGDYTALTQVVSERVAPHADGDAYATTLVDALGARGLVRVAAHLPIGTTTWTSLLATATSSPLWDEGHREALARDLASLVTTTADQDPLTTAAAGTQAPGAGDGQVPGAGDTATPGPGGGQAAAQVLGAGDGRDLGASSGQSGTRGARDPLALDTGFLDALVRGLMAGETGATTGGLRVGWVEYARLTTTAGGGYSNFPGGAPREVRARYLLYDPLAAVLTAAARRPQTVLDVLAPPLPGAAPGPSPGEEYEFRRGRATKVDATTWEWASARTQRSGTACLEALTAAVASASTLRYQATTSQPNPYEARAAWLTEQAVVTLAGVDTTTWTPTARRTTAVILANSIGDIENTASGIDYAGSNQLFYLSLPASWSEHHNKELTALLREALRDDTALTILSKAARIFITHRLATDAFRIPPGTSTGNTPTRILNDLDENAHLYGYVYTACVTGRGVGEDGENPAAGVVLAALDRGPEPVPAPGAPWRPPATPAQATQASDRSLTREQLGNEVITRLYLKAISVLETGHLIPQDAYTLEDGRPAHDWITLGDDGMWHLDQEAALTDPAGLNSWLNDIWTEQDLSRVTTWLAEKFVVGAPETWVPVLTTDPQAPARHAALALLLTAATARLVYGYSHTYQRRAQRHWQHRRARQRRRQERRRRRAQGG